MSSPSSVDGWKRLHCHHPSDCITPRVSHNIAHVWVHILVCVHFICTLYTASYSTQLAHDTGLHTVSSLCGPRCMCTCPVVVNVVWFWTKGPATWINFLKTASWGTSFDSEGGMLKWIQCDGWERHYIQSTRDPGTRDPRTWGSGIQGPIGMHCAYTYGSLEPRWVPRPTHILCVGLCL